MLKRFMPIAMLLAAFTLIAATTPKSGKNPDNLTVHEWGTFTSIAGEGGRAIEWLPFGGPTDLPCFVDRLNLLNVKARTSGTVRMETPVLYFYTPEDMTVNVSVHFPKGLMTEWYPHTPANATGIEWKNVMLQPEATADFPVENGSSHYYAARETDAAPLQVGTQKERFLFYRGVGTFDLPIAANLTGNGQVVVRNLGSDELSSVILFENHNGKMKYRLGGALRGSLTLDAPSTDADATTLALQLEKTLTASGLYPREARAMVNTWHDSWFEEGTRLFYILPRNAVDRTLPLDVRPAAKQTVRVFVGRMELITRDTRDKVADALAHSDRAALEKFGRFLQPISEQVLQTQSPAEKAKGEALVQSIYSSYLAGKAVCK